MAIPIQDESITRAAVPLINPIAAPANMGAGLAKRLDALKGKTIGLLDNAKPRADVVLEEVKAYLESKGAVCSIYEYKPQLSMPLPQEQIERLAKADAVIGAIGD